MKWKLTTQSVEEHELSYSGAIGVALTQCSRWLASCCPLSPGDQLTSASTEGEDFCLKWATSAIP